MHEAPGRKSFTARLFAAGTLLLCAGAACAGGLGVLPILLDFNTQAQAQALWLSNAGDQVLHGRSEERRVGKECVNTGRFRWQPDTYKKNNVNTHVICFSLLLYRRSVSGSSCRFFLC